MFFTNNDLKLVRCKYHSEPHVEGSHPALCIPLAFPLYDARHLRLIRAIWSGAPFERCRL